MVICRAGSSNRGVLRRLIHMHESVHLFISGAGVPYNVSIAAVNRAGPGEFSVFIHFTRELGMFVKKVTRQGWAYRRAKRAKAPPF